MKKQISIQIYSDIHMELGKQMPKILPTAKYLFLAGDICKLNKELFFKFFDYCSPLWEKIFYTPGNTEFYSSKKNYETLDFEYNLKIKEKYKNIFYLNRNFVSLNDDINVYGCVFWTNPNDYSQLYLNHDYNNIQQFSPNKGHNIQSNHIYINKLSKEDLNSIISYLKNNKKQTIIITHFPPTQKNTININCKENVFLGDDNYVAWNNILEYLDLYNIPLWISGHTHWSYDIMYNNTRLISNQIGYKNEHGHTGLYQEGIFVINY